MQTNDPEHPVLDLVVSGKVDTFIEIRPARVRLEGQAGKPLTVQVEILQNKGYPFTILEVRTKRDDVIRCKLVEQCNTDNNRCLLQVENIQTKSGRYADTITVQTDNAVKPSFPIQVVGILH